MDGLVPLENSPAGTPPPRLVYTTPVTFEECEIVLPPTHRLEAESWGAELAESIAEPIVWSFKLGEENTSLTRDASTPLACIPVIVRRAILLDRNDRLPLETQSPEDRWILGPDTWPLSLEGAARDLIEWIGPENCAALRDLAEANMDELHHGLGTGVRNRYGLWRENQALLEDCRGGVPGYLHPDGASGPIIRRAREILRSEEN